MRRLFSALAVALAFVISAYGQPAGIKVVGQAAPGTPAAARPDTVGRVTLSGVVADEQGEGVPFANVTLMSRQGGGLFGASCDRSGAYRVSLPAGSYMAEFSCIGYAKVQREVTVAAATQLPAVVLAASQEKIDAVTVRASTIDYTARGYKVDVGANPLYRGRDLAQVLATSPGLLVTDKEIKVFNKPLYRVYIDDRRVNMTGSMLMQYLASMPSESIKEVEVVAESGAEVDASAMGAAVIRITTKKIMNGGLASITLAGNTGKDKYNLAVNGNADMRMGKYSLYTLVRLPSISKSTVSQYASVDNMLLGTSSVSSSRQTGKNNFNDGGFALGMGYDFNERNTIMAEAYYNKSNSGDSGSAARLQSAGGLEELRSETSSGRKSNPFLKFTGNYIHRFSDGGLLSLDVTYNETENNSSISYNSIASLSGEPLGSWTDFDDSRQRSSVWTASANYSLRLRDKRDMLKTGVRYSALNNTNLHTVDMSGDTDLSTRMAMEDNYEYGERIAAAYLTYDLLLSRWKISAGLRAEHTATRILAAGAQYDNNYLGFYPSVAVSFDIDKRRGHSVTANYTRSISRPRMTDLNPNVRFESLDYYIVGNPLLRHSDQDALLLRFVVANKLSFNAEYDLSDNIAGPITALDDNGLLFTTRDNLAAMRKAMLSVNYSVTLFKRLMLNPSVNYTYKRLRYGGALNSSHSVGASVNGICSLPKGCSLDMIMMWSTPVADGNSRMDHGKPLLNINARKSFMQNTLSVSVGLSDVLNSFKAGNITETPEFRSVTRSTFSSRFVSFVIRYSPRWGDRKVQIERAYSSNVDSQRLK